MIRDLAHSEDAGQAYGNRTGKRVSAWIEIDRWHAWGRLKGAH